MFLDHTVVHFEIPADDIEKIRSFYQSLFGWKFAKYPGPTTYYLVETVPVDDNMMPVRAGTNGGLYERKDAQVPETASPRTTSGSNPWTSTARRLRSSAEKSRFLRWRFLS